MKRRYVGSAVPRSCEQVLGLNAYAPQLLRQVRDLPRPVEFHAPRRDPHQLPGSKLPAIRLHLHLREGESDVRLALACQLLTRRRPRRQLWPRTSASWRCTTPG
eukprot:scaffold109_cov252-Pinguiococcus_pyrenoidosus.AAC.30